MSMRQKELAVAGPVVVAEPPQRRKGVTFKTGGSANGMLREFVTSGISVATATGITNPLDVVKVRMQLLTKTVGVRPPNMVQTAAIMLREEGVSSMYRGLPAALTRSALYGGIRLGLYGPIKQILAGEGEDTKKLDIFRKILAGSLSGGIAAAVSTPLELIKTRLQVKGAAHTSSIAILRHVMATEGPIGMWRGALPGMLRAAALTASQCATYDEVKRGVQRATGWDDNIGTHLACSLVTGLVSTTVTNPIDVVKTLVFVSGTRFKGPMQATAHIFATEGVAGFFKGWSVYYARLGPQTMITFVVAEALRKAAGLHGI